MNVVVGDDGWCLEVLVVDGSACGGGGRISATVEVPL